jgi:hypothetical protein
VSNVQAVVLWYVHSEKASENTHWWAALRV